MDIAGSISRFIHDRAGNFGMITAILAPVLLGVAGISIDITRAVQIRAEMQAVADAAVLAAATSLSNKDDFTEAKAKELVKTFYASQIIQIYKIGKETDEQLLAQVKAIKDATNVTVLTKPNGAKGKLYDVIIDSSYVMPVNSLTALVTGPSITLGTRSASYSATESQNALSMFLILDQSGSMGYNTNTVECIRNNYYGNCAAYGYVKKMDALKSAVASLLQVIEEADPEHIYARLGAVSYNEKMQSPTGMAWGTSAVEKYTKALNANGWTNSGEATALAYNTLAPTGANSENAFHKAKNDQTPSKFIILMTDGKNENGNGALLSADNKTKAACDLARKDSSNRIIVYSVAFMAPPEGQNLLKYCATTSSHYFNADNSAELIAAFKAIGQEAAKGMTRLTQ
ncbi:Flp pilus assembly protein TadG [Neorhizobium huautlense]|uniref:Flp pilus assembly protein TadG n=1 Tax=Neorhizobium huautlense TaxID=67774 RepID=A0ABT9PNS0_9HYPH|nr:TadE/TadG family type IV pilus assembly protein [Neorhizobium huautlense]MDP9836113.1 Flp pilus assembly protein TadG [Neorhizobium huautlense]